MPKKKKTKQETPDSIKDTIGPDESPELEKGGRSISKLQAQIPEMHIMYADLVRVAMDRQGMTQIQLGVNDPYDREQGIITTLIYLSPRGMGILLKLLTSNYQQFLKNEPDLAERLSMQPLRDLLK